MHTSPQLALPLDARATQSVLALEAEARHVAHSRSEVVQVLAHVAQHTTVGHVPSSQVHVFLAEHLLGNASWHCWA
mgnify:CR=1 FL=1